MPDSLRNIHRIGIGPIRIRLNLFIQMSTVFFRMHNFSITIFFNGNITFEDDISPTIKQDVLIFGNI